MIVEVEVDVIACGSEKRREFSAATGRFGGGDMTGRSMDLYLYFYLVGCWYEYFSK